jgi:hypothetical protein
MAAEWSITCTSGCWRRWPAISHIGAASAPATLISSATSSPRDFHSSTTIAASR